MSSLRSRRHSHLRRALSPVFLLCVILCGGDRIDAGRDILIGWRFRHRFFDPLDLHDRSDLSFILVLDALLTSSLLGVRVDASISSVRLDAVRRLTRLSTWMFCFFTGCCFRTR